MAAGYRPAAMSDPDRPEFGPSGYLPPRAAQRARKIVLRAPLGLQWVVGSLVVGAAVVVAGVLWLGGDDAPADPWIPVTEVDELEGTRPVDDPDVLLVANGRIRAIVGAEERGIAYCPESRRLEGPDGGVWTLTGRGLDGTPSLEEHPVRLHEGVVYIDPTRTGDAPTPSDEPAEPACR